jgi:predicted HicB family RNase H-like nuclease
MNAKQRRTLIAVFARPTSPSIVFSDIEALVIALGGTVTEREGSRVKIELKGELWRCHRPHPGKEAMNTMTYKGYTARVEFDERDEIFVGRILGMRSIVSFHGDTVAQLRSEFEGSVEDFLSECKALGVKPEKPASGKLLLRVPPEVHGAALVAAQASGKSLNQWATEVLQNATHA